VRYQGRIVDAVALWSDYVEFPPNMRVDDQTTFLPLVVCPNPDHITTKRHFQINVKKPLVHCFAECGISGTFESAIAQLEGISHRSARKLILKHSRIGSAPIPKKRGKRKQDTVSQISLDDFTFLPQVATEYLTTRAIHDSSVAKWEIRWDSDELRIVIPAYDARHRLRFVIKRAVMTRQQPKYLYAPEGAQKTEILFGLDKINPGMLRSSGVVLVEGSIDTIRNHQHGITNTVGVLGSRLSLTQARLISNLRPKRIITMFDADSSGIEATISVRRRLGSHPIAVCRYPTGKTDPAELSQREVERVIDRALPYAKFHQIVTRLISSKEREHVGS